MKITKILVLFALLFSTNSFSQKPKLEANGYTITITTKNLKKEKLILFLKYGTTNQMVVSDSLTITSNEQKVIFKKKSRLIDAIYFLKFASQKNELLLAIDNNSTLSLAIDNNNIETILCNQNALNKDFIAFQIASKALDNTQKVLARERLLSKYPTSILNLYFKIENKLVAKIPEIAEERIKSQSTFFNFMDKNDQRIYLLPNINQLLYVFTIQTVINDENYIKNIDLVLKKLDCNSKNYAVYTRWFLANLSYFESKNLDLAFNHLFKNYIESNRCKSFSAGELATFRNKYQTNKLFPYTKKVPEIILADKDAKEYSLSTIYPNYDYTFVAFYSPTCHHCQQTMPFANSTFETLKSKYPTKKMQLIAVLNDPDESKWQTFIAERKISNWLNLKSNDSTRAYQNDFNAYSNPNFFFLDKKGTVLLKSFNPMAIEELIKNN
ncbi:thioredoxin-like domain-containing protein [Flavobacterium sp.]|uniref:TlpA family protein disulfide reductase n=1 Tax=Flavobacterium sp. TaxID=239 RepID=UPI0026287EA3|nr:thioredoxin-like domain-containing protein [Flavobacterium sp.]